MQGQMITVPFHRILITILQTQLLQRDAQVRAVPAETVKEATNRRVTPNPTHFQRCQRRQRSQHLQPPPSVVNALLPSSSKILSVRNNGQHDNCQHALLSSQTTHQTEIHIQLLQTLECWHASRTRRHTHIHSRRHKNCQSYATPTTSCKQSVRISQPPPSSLP